MTFLALGGLVSLKTLREQETIVSKGLSERECANRAEEIDSDDVFFITFSSYHHYSATVHDYRICGPSTVILQQSESRKVKKSFSSPFTDVLLCFAVLTV